MEPFLAPIALNETSYNVNLLHQVLAILGLPVAQEEVDQNLAGQSTIKQVRTLQTQLEVPVNQATLIDQATAVAITEALKKIGFITASRSFTVSGMVRQANGTFKKHQQLLAFDLDLRGVAVYRTVQSLTDIQKNGGFEYLGQTHSDNQGNYRLTFYDWQYRRAERKKADVVVYAVVEEEIIGLSRLVNAEDYSEKGLVRDLAVMITQLDERSEYEVLMTALTAFLQESETTLAEIATSADQMAFTASELDVDLSHLILAAKAEALANADPEKGLVPELLYGLGRQDINLTWPALYKQRLETLRGAINRSMEAGIIRPFTENEVMPFLQILQLCSNQHLLDDKDPGDPNPLKVMLSHALPETDQQLAFVTTLGDFKSGDFHKFWTEHLPAQPEFADRPELIEGLLLTQQLTLLSGNHQPLVRELQVNQQVTSAQALLDLEESDWHAIIEKAGLPEFMAAESGMDQGTKVASYAASMQSLVNAAFPTQRIAKMVAKGELPVERNSVSENIGTFLAQNERFDFAGSRIHDFDDQIQAVSGQDYAEVRGELLKIQRVFQVSPSPQAMTILLENNLHSAYSIATIPSKSFIKTYSDALGGERVAFAIHQRASHINARTERNALYLREHLYGLSPRLVQGETEYQTATAAIENQMPNFAELLGSPDMCQCEHCRSVYSPAAYFVDLLRFLEKSSPNADGHTPYDMLVGKTNPTTNAIDVHGRRPDLAHLPLTCENANTLIPYIDLANEIMEYYTAHDALTDFAGYDTGSATAAELRANPQYVNFQAYRILSNNRKKKKSVHPFTLPYHQPLDVIRTYSDHLQVSRYQVLRAMHPLPDETGRRAIAAESLQISPEEYTILTGEATDSTPDSTPVHTYFGYKNDADFQNIQNETDANGKPRGIRPLLERTGLTYPELVELIKTRFINPYQDHLYFLEALLAYAPDSLAASTFYSWLEQIKADTLSPADQGTIVEILDGYNNALTFTQFAQWVSDHFNEFQQVITLYEPDSKCGLDSTQLKTIQSIYEETPTSGIGNETWSKMHRFIRLWRKLGWTLHQTDLMLSALGENNITPETISKLEAVSLLATATKSPLDQLAVLWGHINTSGDKSLYQKLFLNKAVQQIDPAFQADGWGNYLQAETENLADHQATILAAFRLKAEDLTAILSVAQVVEAGSARNLSIEDGLNLHNLSTIYRYAGLAKALKMPIPDLCQLIRLFDAAPFSRWDKDTEQFIDIAPQASYEFYQLALSIKTAGFKPTLLAYILEGSLPTESKLGLAKDKILQTAQAIRTDLTAIEQAHPQTPDAPLTTEMLTAKLSLTFQPDIVSRFMGILERSVSFETVTDANLDVIIPDDDDQDKIAELVTAGLFSSEVEAAAFLRAFSEKYTYVKGSGRLICNGIMSDLERTVLTGLPHVNPTAVDELYAAPETFISDHFKDAPNYQGLFDDQVEAYAMLLDHPAQTPTTNLEAKLGYVYDHFLPLLKNKLRQQSVTQHIATLIGLEEASTNLLLTTNMETLIDDLSTAGFSASYFNANDWGTSDLALERTDNTIDFSWERQAPHEDVSANPFSVRWQTYLTAPASDTYTFLVRVTEADEVFRLYLDDTLLLEKTAVDTNPSWERIVELNAAQMYLLTLEYAAAVENIGISLSWKRATTALEIIPALVAYPAVILDDFMTQATLLHRAAQFITGFKLSPSELSHFLTYPTDFDHIDFKALQANHWLRMHDYTTLRQAVPQSQALLTDVFALANRLEPLPTVTNLTQRLVEATAWHETSLTSLVNTHFALDVADFKNEVALNQLYEALKIVAKTGVSVETLDDWGRPETAFDVLHKTAQLIKNSVKAKYEVEDWLEVAGNLSNNIRENQQKALVSYLLQQPAIQTWGARDADGLFEYFLIDVQMGACMDTSRIVQANAAVQMFVNRCLLNLESHHSGSAELGVSPGAIDLERWQWMKNYRVWEANRKVFLYPENWLEPEWRNDRSQFFKALESYLVQNDITARNVEQGFRNYLTSLNEVANLEVCGMYQENYDEDGKLKYLHVFARTHNAPYTFYYRTWNEYGKWSAWETVQLDIRSVEHGENSGVHLIPVVWKKRLFLFWPEFLEKPKSPSQGSSNSVEDISVQSMSSLESRKHWEIRLAWSEYVDGKWAPKQLIKEFITTSTNLSYSEYISDYRFYVIFPSPKVLSFSLMIWCGIRTTERMYATVGRFFFSDIQSKPTVQGVEYDEAYILDSAPDPYNILFMKWGNKGRLDFEDNTYLERRTAYELLYPHEIFNFYSNIGSSVPTFPFFFSDAYRTYFVRPVAKYLIPQLKKPEYSNHYKPEIAEAGRQLIPVWLLGNETDDMSLVGIISRSVTETPIGRQVAAADPLSPSEESEESATTTGVVSASQSLSNKYKQEMGQVNDAFQTREYTDVILSSYGNHRGYGRTVLEFHTFYHPFSSQYVTRLNQGGISALMSSDTEAPANMGGDTQYPGSTFKINYDPNFDEGLVKHYQDFEGPPNPRTAYQENVCFDKYGANSLYNWELFFHAPLYIATRLSKNGQYEKAMQWFHYIFDPTTDELPREGENEISRYWKVLPFKTTQSESLEDLFRNFSADEASDTEDPIIGEWRDNPFDPHLVASNRPLAYMKHVVIKYVENLIAWGDSLFRQFTRESVYEALQIYVIANHILGPYPEFVPKRGKIKAETYLSLRNKWDDFSNALVELENIFPYSGAAPVSESAMGPSLLGIGSAFYFCIPANEKLLEYWDTVADRLFKIRHCQDIEGVERQLALFAPPIDPALLIQATSQGLSLGSILANLSSPPPIYRFSFLVQKANEFCADVKALGSALLAALEKKDGEELSRLRATQETNMLELVGAIRERQVLEARANRENLSKARETAVFRLQHYLDLLGNDSVTAPAEPTIEATLTADSQLPVDTSIPAVVTDVDELLVDSDERGVKLISKEKEELDKSQEALIWQRRAMKGENIAGTMSFIPNFSGEFEPLGMGASISYGGSNIGGGLSALAKVPQWIATRLTHEAAQAAKTAGFIRREQEWTLQANLAAKEIIQLDKQITSAEIRRQVSEKELANHQQQLENAQEVELFLKDKFTNQELYQWQKEQLLAVYKQSYDLAFDMALKAEKAYQYELGTETASFIQYGYWDNSKQGLVSGEKLQLALRQLEQSYLAENRREVELTKSISLALLNPLALIELKETGKCYLSLPEALFDLDFQGHYFRRIKSVSLSIPCVVGPYTTVNCTLRLLKNSTRINTRLNDGQYEQANDDGLWIDDDRFRSSNVPVTSIATSRGQNDAGMFEFNFRDERYLPFERAGVISDWLIELSPEKELRQFDYATISDVILQLNYTSREGGGPFKEEAVRHIKDFIMNSSGLTDQPLMHMFSMKHEFSTEWHKFRHPVSASMENVLSFTLGMARFPFLAQSRKVVVMKIDVFTKCAREERCHLILSHTTRDGDFVTSTPIAMPVNESYGGLNKATVHDDEPDLENLDIAGKMELSFTDLAANEVEDIFLVFHYKLEDKDA